MNIENIVVAFITGSIGGSVVGGIIKYYFEKKILRFNEKKKLYHTITIFSEIYLYPNRAKYTLTISGWNIQEFSDDENKEKALHNLKTNKHMLSYVSNSKKLFNSYCEFIQNCTEKNHEILLESMKKDLWKLI